jgi:SlyX protein
MEERLTDLESRYMRQERIIQELLDLVYRHQQSIDRLGREMEEIREQLQIALPSLVERPEDEEPPPHY